MAKRKKTKGFQTMDFIVLGGLSFVAYMLFKTLSKSSSLGSCTVLPNGFPYAGFMFNEANANSPKVIDKSKKIRLGLKGYEAIAIQIYANWLQTKDKLVRVDGVISNFTLNSLKEQLNGSEKQLLESGNMKLSDLIPSDINSVLIKNQKKKFRSGFIPDCPNLTEFYFGYLVRDDGSENYGDLDNSVIDEI